MKQFRLFVLVAIFFSCGKDKKEVALPQLTTAAITNLTYNSATSGGTIKGDGGAAITASGVCWSKTNNTPTLSDSKTTGNTASGSFTAVMNNLEENTTYYVRAYATNSAGTGYGEVLTFTTPVNTSLPELTTAPITNLTYNSATSGGTITDNGGAAITASGICWSKTNNTPTLADSTKTGTTASGSFTSVMNNLEENTTYYVRAFATNSVGTGYGDVVTFTTPVNITVPELTTAAITNLSHNSATSGGTITANGGATITASGICWSKTNNTPTIAADSVKSGTTSSGSFTYAMNNLDENTTYYVRAFATNSAGTGYGNVITFTTPVNITVPQLTTAAITNLSHNTATSGGTITANGGAAITASGICWSKTNNPPTVTDSKTTGTTASGSFTSVMDNLDASTTYYVRAYATNSAGTGYGNVITFTTTADANTVTFMYNGETVTYGIITSPVTGRKWLDRNLGATRVATSFTDRMAYGHLFQWGRPADGHQVITYSSNTSGSGGPKTTTLATSDVPGHATFITPDNTQPINGVYVYDWRDDQNTNRWAINNQGSCPSGWHVPTTAEWDAETGITNATTAFSQLKLTAAGYRYGDEDGSGRDGTVRTAGNTGWYWSSSVWPSGAGISYHMEVASGGSFTDQAGRAYGGSIRCIKN